MSAVAMSDAQQESFEGRLKTLVVVGWAFLSGAFALGLWVATIQIAVNENTKAKTSDQLRIRDLELRESANNEKLANILKIVDRIDRKLNP